MSTPPVRRTISNPTTRSDAAADAQGLTLRRDVLQLRRLLPIEEASGIVTRAFEVGSDEAAWIEVNNRAFTGHPDQSAMTHERLAAQSAEPWFDPDGFRLHTIDGRLAAFCWTKRHPATPADPAMGEIYVIGVDPDFQGRGLGRALTVAGLEWLAAAGESVGMLYVDATNTAARGLYDALGFHTHHVDRLYEAPPTK